MTATQPHAAARPNNGAAPEPALGRFAVLRFMSYPDNGSGVLALVRVRIGDLVIEDFQLQGYVEAGRVRYTVIPPPTCWVNKTTRERLETHILAAWTENQREAARND